MLPFGILNGDFAGGGARIGGGGVGAPQGAPTPPLAPHLPFMGGGPVASPSPIGSPTPQPPIATPARPAPGFPGSGAGMSSPTWGSQPPQFGGGYGGGFGGSFGGGYGGGGFGGGGFLPFRALMGY